VTGQILVGSAGSGKGDCHLDTASLPSEEKGRMGNHRGEVRKAPERNHQLSEVIIRMVEC
jgi:hypothetical protein